MRKEGVVFVLFILSVVVIPYVWQTIKAHPGARNIKAGAKVSLSERPGQPVDSGTCNDSDGGRVLTNKGSVYSGTKGSLTHGGTDSCVNKKTLREYYCEMNKTTRQWEVKSEERRCPYECDDGKCLVRRNPRQEQAAQAGSDQQEGERQRCIDADNSVVNVRGDDLYTRSNTSGWLRGQYVTRTDNCYDEGQIAEYYCLNDHDLGVQFYPCPGSSVRCQNGECPRVVTISSCGEPEGGWQDGSVYILNADIEPPRDADQCFLIENHQNIVIDCQDHVMPSHHVPGEGYFKGIVIRNSRDVHIRNCRLSDYHIGIRLTNTGIRIDENNSENITITGCDLQRTGISISNSRNTRLESNTLNGDGRENATGIDWNSPQGQNNVMRGNRIEGFGTGLAITNNTSPELNPSPRIELDNNTICENGHGDLFFDMRCRRNFDWEGGVTIVDTGNTFGTIDNDNICFSENSEAWPDPSRYSPCP